MANTHSIDLEAGSSQYLSAADSDSLSITGSLTMEMWIKRESTTGAAMHLFGKMRDSGTQKSYLFELNGDNQLNAYISSNGSTYTGQSIGAVGTFSATGVWMHVAVVYTASAGKVEVFKNGVSVGSASVFPLSIFEGTEIVTIGRNLSYGQYFDGLIDDVRLWSKARTATEILADYTSELNGNEANLNAYWKLNNSLDDSTANGNTLTNPASAPFSTDVAFLPPTTLTTANSLVQGVKIVG